MAPSLYEDNLHSAFLWLRQLIITMSMQFTFSPLQIMVYAPLSTKSMKITYMPLAETLASRGHKVTVVMPFTHSKTMDNLEVITIESRFPEALKNFSR